MTTRFFHKYLGLVVLLVVIPFAAVFAADESYIKTLEGKIKKGDSVIVIDDKFLNMPLSEWNLLKNLSIQNIVSFELRQDTAYLINRPFTCTLNISIKYFTSRDQDKPTEINDVKLVVQYDTATGRYLPVNDRYLFKNAFKVIVIVNSITSPEFGDKIPTVFRIKNNILVSRKYPFNPQVSFPVNVQLTGDDGGNSNDQPSATARNTSNTGDASGTNTSSIVNPNGHRQADIQWSSIPGAEEYDVEWTYVDRFSERGVEIINIGGGGLTGPFNIPDNKVADYMRFDNSRVTVNTYSYQINLPYNEGFVLARIRAASYDPSTHVRITTPWQYRGSNSYTNCLGLLTKHEEFLNWQYTASFAEAGKRKEVITYFDGTLRNRQMVTMVNIDVPLQGYNNVVVVGETIYDNMGRPAANILPAPVPLPTGGYLDYNDAFNRNSAGDPYNYTNLHTADVEPGPSNPTSNCAVTADPLAPANSGAAQYYSPSNPFLTHANFKYFTQHVPDANGFPFSVTQYTPDNTGRIRRQGGVGQNFQIGTDHETKYYYSKPGQEELDRLFGVEAGDASHYLKNAVIDANGQVSVSYIDANGKTVATALAGNKPLNVDGLPNAEPIQTQVLLNLTLIKNADFIRDAGNLVMEASATFFAGIVGPNTIRYSFTPQALQTIPVIPPAGPQFCNNCYYDISVVVKDECGYVIASSQPTPPMTGLDVSCHLNDPAVVTNLNVVIPKVGEYTVVYTIRLSEDVIRQNTDYYIEHNTDLHTIQYFFEDELTRTDLSGCYNDCATCEQKLGTEAEFTANVLALFQEQADIKYPMFPYPVFDPNSPNIQNWITTTYHALVDHCQQIQDQCLPQSPCEQKLQMMKYDVRPGGQYALYDPTSYDFREPNINVMGFYQDPSIPDFEFLDDNGITRHIHDAAVTPALFIKAYIQHPEWSDEFVKKHIEYCSYLWCTNPGYGPDNTNEISYQWDQKVREEMTLAQAINLDYFNSSYDALLKKDPFFNGGWGDSYYTNMQGDLKTFSDVIRFFMLNGSGVQQPAKTVLELIDWMLYCKIDDPLATPAAVVDSWNNCNPNNDCRSRAREWDMYKNYYLQLKSKYFQLVKYEHNPGCKNCFIGNDNISNNFCQPPQHYEDYSIPPPQIDPVTGEAHYFIVYQGGHTPFPYNYVIRWEYLYNNIVYTGSINIMAGQFQAEISFDYPVPTIIAGGIKIMSITCAPGTVAGPCDQHDDPLNSFCPYDPNYEFYKFKHKIFDDFTNFENYLDCIAGGLSGAPTSNVQSLNSMRDEAIRNLDALKTTWYNILTGVVEEENERDVMNAVPVRFQSLATATGTALIQTVVNELYAISARYIREVADEHTMHSVSTIPTGFPYAGVPPTYYSFHDVFQHFIDPALIVNGFNEHLLSVPFPYDRPPFLSNPVAEQVNTDICDNVVMLKNLWTSINSGISFHQFLIEQLSDDYNLTEAQLDEIINKCSNGCTYLSEPMTLPVAFVSAFSGYIPYVDCNARNMISDFNALYPGVVQGTKLYRVTFTNYANKQLGFGLSYFEYEDFMNGDCSTDPNSLLFNKAMSPLLANPGNFDCAAYILKNVFDIAGQEYAAYIEIERRKFRNAYIAKCLSTNANLKLEGTEYEYQYTLYYYDQSGNLVKTIPPEGVKIFTPAQVADVELHRNDDPSVSFIVPIHTMPTLYYYNSLNQVVKQQTPDAGMSEFFYDRLGRLVASQNAEQRIPLFVDSQNPLSRYSYTKYDFLGRIVEVGEKLNALNGPDAISEVNSRDDNYLKYQWYPSGTDRQITVTAYDEAPSWVPVQALPLKNLRKRVAATAILSTGSPWVGGTPLAATYYSYDCAGNVARLVQDIADLRVKEQSKITPSSGLKTIDYDYDLISGKVNKVSYQKGKWDEFFYKYEYDAENRVVNAYSSRDDWSNIGSWSKDAHYVYYLHGPLARTEISGRSGDPVQGIDYAYTLQGWLKGVNSSYLNQDIDMSNDGKNLAGNPFKLVARDAYSYSLGYFSGDYTAIGPGVSAFAMEYAAPANSLNQTGSQLFNGNISNASYNISMLNNNLPFGYSYRYDQLNRLTAMNQHAITAPNNWDNSTLPVNFADRDYAEQISYDANGNILTYKRNGAGGTNGTKPMDDFTYQYPKYDAATPSIGGKKINNRLRYIRDQVSSTIYTGDMDNQTTLTLAQVQAQMLPEQGTDNYLYDAIGNLKKDVKEGITNINWTVYGKINNIAKSTTYVNYVYDAAGNRVYKVSGNSNGTGTTKTTYYVRDAQGNVMAVYEFADPGTVGVKRFSWIEQGLYGSSRLGIAKPNVNITTVRNNDGHLPTDNFDQILGSRNFELTNHLGNVMATISDNRTTVMNGSNLDYYKAIVITANDYYPFGMIMIGRNYNNGTAVDYRFGFNGKENDNEVKGEGNQIDFGARAYDPRIGRWLSLDPLQAKYPSLSPYNFTANSPIRFVDPDGKVIRIYYDGGKYYDYKPGITPPKGSAEIVMKVHEACMYNMNTDKGTEIWNQLGNSKGILEINQITLDGTHKQDVEFKQMLGQKNKSGEEMIGSINWDPNADLAVTDNGVGGYLKGFLSPSTVLLHELGHGQGADDALTKSKTDENAITNFILSATKTGWGEDEQYETKEESINTQQRENVYVRQINAWEQKNGGKNPAYQPIRENHKGTPTALHNILKKRIDVNRANPTQYNEWRKFQADKGIKENDGIKENVNGH